MARNPISKKPNPVVLVAGPTASGKSGLALAVARQFDGVVINADALQVYRELHIVTARPGEAEAREAPHRLYGVLSAAERCSAARWRRLALAEIAEAHGHGKLPILCGGTGLYLKALREGLAEIPPVPTEVLERGKTILDSRGVEGLRHELGARDPISHAKIAPRDRQRLLRAWSVHEATGRALSAWQQDSGDQDAEPGLRFIDLVLLPSRPELHAAIETRFRAMVETGALDEVAGLMGLGLDPSLPAMKALGVPELARYLQGETDLATAVEAGIQSTRKYAKRQETWLQTQVMGQKNNVSIFETQFSESLLEKIFPIIRQFLLTGPM